MKTWLANEQALLSKHILAKNLPHAILMSGVAGSGKQELALWLINVLHCKNIIQGEVLTPCLQCKNCNLLAKHNYPDHLLASSEKATLGVDNIRQVSSFFEKKAQLGNLKTVLIPSAEIMTISAANALLKTLEEPTDNSVIILLSSERDTLLPTIISRCRLFEIRAPSGTKLMEAIGTKSTVQSIFNNLSHLPELSTVELADEYKQFETDCLSFLQGHKEKSIFIKQVYKGRYGLRWFEKVITNLIRTNAGWLESSNLSENSSPSIKSDTLWKIYNKIVATVAQVKTLSQANSQFLIEKLIIDVDQLLKNE